MILYNVHVYSGYIIRLVKLGKNQGWGIEGDSQDLTRGGGGGGRTKSVFICVNLLRDPGSEAYPTNIVARRNFCRGGGGGMHAQKGPLIKEESCKRVPYREKNWGDFPGGSDGIYTLAPSLRAPMPIENILKNSAI